MIRVSVEIREDALTYRARVTAPSIERALEIMGEGKPGRRMRLLFSTGIKGGGATQGQPPWHQACPAGDTRQRGRYGRQDAGPDGSVA
jgi:hypothetical protein